MTDRIILSAALLLLCGAAFAFGFTGHPTAVRLWDGVVRGVSTFHYYLVEYPAQRLVRWWRSAE